MDFAEMKYLQYKKDEVATEYLAECARLIVNNSAGGEERYTMTSTLHDLLNPHIEERTADEIVADIKEGLSKLGA